MELLKNLRKDSKAEHWQDGLLWLFYSAIFDLLPLWVTICLILAFTNKEVELAYISGKGEFLLYSASYLGGALYLIMRDFKTRTFPSRPLLSPILIFILLLCALLFGGIALLSILGEGGTPQLLTFINRKFLATFSITVLPVSVLLAYIVAVADNVRTAPDIPGIQKRQLDELSSDFEEIKD